MQNIYNPKMTIRSAEDLDKLKRWLRRRRYNEAVNLGDTYILTQNGERAGVVVIEDPASIHRNALRLIGVQVMEAKDE